MHASPINLNKVFSDHIASWRSWKEAVPRSILKQLTTRFPQIHINLEQFPVGHETTDMVSQQHDLNLSDGLLGCGNIFSTCAEINYEHPISARRIMEVEMSCPSFETLELRVGKDFNFKMRESHESGAHDFCLRSGDKLPPVRKLVYETRLLRPLLPLILPTFWNW